MKNCELCKGLARIYCESDQASLCWNCDVKVHGANFLVARHTRSVLCHTCQSPTAWKASGAELDVTVTVCESCVTGFRKRGGGEGNLQEGNGDSTETEDDDSDSDDDDDFDDDEDGDDEEEDSDNQVVPWSSSSSTPPPQAASSSSSEESVCKFNNSGGEVSSKRMRNFASDLGSQEHRDRPSPKRKYCSTVTAPAELSGAEDEEAGLEYLKPLKIRRNDSDGFCSTRPGLHSGSVIKSLRKSP
ncbi:hypothetical protein UlMin_014302 [Ulmus minor]